jgi:Leucine-rich repeat (LRR) protein
MDIDIQNFFNTTCCPTYNFDVSSTSWTTEGVTNKASFESTFGVVVSDFDWSNTRIKAKIISNPTSLEFVSVGIVSVISVNFISIVGLSILDLGGNQLTSFNPSIALPSGLSNLSLSYNQLASFNPSIALPSALSIFFLGGNQLTSFNPSIALPSGLVYLEVNDNQLTSFNPSIALPSGLSNLSLSYNQFTLEGYTASEPWANSLPNGTMTIDFSSNPDSVVGTNLEAILVSKGYNVIG